MSLVKITQIRIYFLVCRKVIEFTNYGIDLNILINPEVLTANLIS
ncbi:unnamed protein product [Staurois parvus]|uniref:Uncharacterized protein n=1 Tax=Staurois parvus TaxID=386267 RepID=A0ABN9GVU9_9NEOB|nr:unnamed protein product [Staurois parvus]